MSTERRNYPKVSLQGDARILLAGIVRNGKLIHMTPAGVEIEIRHQLVEQWNRFKSDEGLFPDFEVEFEIPCAGSNTRKVSSRCTVAHCRRLRQDCYHLGLYFKMLEDSDEALVSDYVYHSVAA